MEGEKGGVKKSILAFSAAADDGANWVPDPQNPRKIGIAAGIMKDCDYDDVKAKIDEGWRFMEFGTVTAEPNEPDGDRRHVLLGSNNDISWNNCGLKSIGLDKFIKNYEKCRQILLSKKVKVNISIFANCEQGFKPMIEKLLKFEEVRIILNIWCPNNLSHRFPPFDPHNELKEIVDYAFRKSDYENENERRKIISERLGFKMPNLGLNFHTNYWKAPEAEMARWYWAIKNAHIAYVILTNGLYCKESQGTLSGKGLASCAEYMLMRFHNLRESCSDENYRLTIVSCGAIMNSTNVIERFNYHADAVQICTAILMGKKFRDFIKDE